MGLRIDYTLWSAYNTHHRKIRRTQGSASMFACITCGVKARDWAYQHTDSDEFIFPTGQVGSLDFTHYSPMCRSCHNSMDGRGSIGGKIGGRKGGLITGKRRRRCGACGLQSTPGGVGRHQQSSGCEGYVDL